MTRSEYRIQKRTEIYYPEGQKANRTVYRIQRRGWIFWRTCGEWGPGCGSEDGGSWGAYEFHSKGAAESKIIVLIDKERAEAGVKSTGKWRVV